MNGIVIFASSKNFKVNTKNGIVNAIAISKLKNSKIIVGDNVKIEINNLKGREDDNLIVEVFPRKNTFSRPKVSNIDNVFIVSSIKEPDFSDYYLDKLITMFQFNNVKPFLIFTKVDLKMNEDVKETINEYKKMGYETFLFFKKFTLKDIKKIENISKNKLNAFTGNTGVGKTTIVNFLSTNLNLKTQNISSFLKRGKHTTTTSNIYKIFEDSFFIDTPGFSSFVTDMTKKDISHNFLTFSKYIEKCKFSNCLHKNETGCNVKNRYSKKKYDNYLKFLKEIE